MTPTDIGNLAFDLLREQPISSIDENTTPARWLKRNYAVTRDALLEAAEWDFAMKRYSLPALSDKPAFGWEYAYAVPGDVLRVLPLTYEGKPEGYEIPHVVENGQILTNQEGPLRVRAIIRQEEAVRYPATFVKALAARLALDMAHTMTGKSSYVQIASSLYQEALNNAWLTNAIQGTIPRPAADEWIMAR